MQPLPQDNPRQKCEHILREGIRRNNELEILPSEVAIAERLLRRGLELSEAYDELYRKLHMHPNALATFLGIVLTTAAFWSPEKIAQARTAREALAKVNQQIAKKAADLADLLQQRTELHNTSGFSSGTHYSICDVISDAAKNNYLFASYVQERFEALRTQFDLKYWPSLEEVLQQLAFDAATASTEATDPLTAAATTAVRPSLADFFKALFAHIDENGPRYGGLLPRELSVTDGTLASLANCTLDLSPEESVDAPYVKRFRQRERQSGK